MICRLKNYSGTFACGVGNDRTGLAGIFTGGLRGLFFASPWVNISNHVLFSNLRVSLRVIYEKLVGKRGGWFSAIRHNDCIVKWLLVKLKHFITGITILKIFHLIQLGFLHDATPLQLATTGCLLLVVLNKSVYIDQALSEAT